MNSVMRKALLASAVSLAMAGAAQADSIYYDVGPLGINSGDANTTTDVFDQFSISAQTTTTQFDTDGSGGLTVGDMFSDMGEGRVESLLAPGFVDDEGLMTAGGYEFTFQWSGLNGSVTNIADAAAGPDNVNISYDAGAQIDFYLDTGLDSNYGGTVGASDNANFGNGTYAFTVTVTGGTGTNTFGDYTDGTTFTNGSSFINGEVTNVASGLFYDDTNHNGIADAQDEDWATALLNDTMIMAFLDQNTDNVVAVAPGSNGGMFDILSDHNGSLDITVPEPSTLALLGGSLIGLAGVGRRRQRRA